MNVRIQVCAQLPAAQVARGEGRRSARRERCSVKATKARLTCTKANPMNGGWAKMTHPRSAMAIVQAKDARLGRRRRLQQRRERSPD